MHLFPLIARTKHREPDSFDNGITPCQKHISPTFRNAPRRFRPVRNGPAPPADAPARACSHRTEHIETQV